jgi:hypothetical protein
VDASTGAGGREIYRHHLPAGSGPVPDPALPPHLTVAMQQKLINFYPKSVNFYWIID